jgi:hypothetical protein
MNSTTHTEEMAAKLWSQYDRKQLTRMYNAVWRKIERRTGSTSSWDWPTLHLVYPEYYFPLRAIMMAGRNSGK